MTTRCLDALLTRRATRFWTVALAGLIALGLALHVSAWVAFPTIATADTNIFTKILHQIERGEVPNLRAANAGYALFMLGCKVLPLSLNKGLPLVQHLLELAAAVAIAVWMRRHWGVLASLMTAALILVSSYRAIWSQFGHMNALLCSLVPLAVIVLTGGAALGRRRAVLGAGVLCLMVFITREEALLPALLAPLVVLCFCRRMRGPCLRWFGTIAVVLVFAIAGRVGVNFLSTGLMTYSTHGGEAVAWRVLQQDALVVAPRPASLDRFYSAAAASGAEMSGEHYDYETLWRVGRDQFGMTREVAIEAMSASAVECIRMRPVVYLSIVLRDVIDLWTNPEPSLEWAAFEKSDPAKFHQDAVRLEWTADSRAEFPLSYEPSGAQRLFRRLALLRPGESFAMRPLIVCFLIGAAALLCGVGCGRQRFRRWWFVGLAGSVVGLTLFYAAIADVPFRYRMSMEWAFFAVASLGLVLPLRALRGKAGLI